MPAWSNWVSSQWIYIQNEGGSNSIPPVKFDRALNTGQIGWKFTEITFAWSNWVSSQWIYTQFEGGVKFYPPDQIQLVEFNQALNTGQIGWQFTEITFVCLPGQIGYHLSGFTPNLRGGQILSPSQI